MAVLADQRKAIGDLWLECRCGVSIVMEVKLDFAKAVSGELTESIEKIGPILFTGKEPAVAWRPALAVAKLGEVRIALCPSIDAGATDIVGCMPP